jgi:rfaE bifunctional protein kinase chain/domain
MKIFELEKLASLLKDLRSSGKKIVHCHGVFDLLHIGHIRHFEQAGQFGDVLVVTITPDQYVDKGPHRPAFNQDLRAEAIASLSIVDYVAINKWPTAEETIRLLQPDYYAKGAEFKQIVTDMTGKMGGEERVAREIGTELVFIDDIVFSSTNLINRYLSNWSEEINEYLGLFRQRSSLDEILDIIESMSRLKVLVIGDTILDEYQFCEAIGKSSKDPALTVKYQSSDMFAGGALAVANHVASFAYNVKLLTVLGQRESHEDLIRSQLLANIDPFFIYQPDSPTIIKKRYIDGNSFNKLFEVYIIDDSGLADEQDKVACRWLKENLTQYDLVVVADYGHGAVSDNMMDTLCEGARFLAVNVQANSGNFGFHTVTRYQHADFVSLSEHEIRLEMRQRNGEIRPMMENLLKKLGARQFIVTRGRKGCMILNDEMDFVAVPTFAQNVVDRVGAGDALFAVTSIGALLDVSNEINGFIGNVAGSLAVEILGNKKTIDKLALKKYIVSLLK